jgi:hypothetical protein
MTLKIREYWDEVVQPAHDDLKKRLPEVFDILEMLRQEPDRGVLMCLEDYDHNLTSDKELTDAMLQLSQLDLAIACRTLYLHCTYAHAEWAALDNNGFCHFSSSLPTSSVDVCHYIESNPGLDLSAVRLWHGPKDHTFAEVRFCEWADQVLVNGLGESKLLSLRAFVMRGCICQMFEDERVTVGLATAPTLAECDHLKDVREGLRHMKDSYVYGHLHVEASRFEVNYSHLWHIDRKYFDETS